MRILSIVFGIIAFGLASNAVGQETDYGKVFDGLQTQQTSINFEDLKPKLLSKQLNALQCKQYRKLISDGNPQALIFAITLNSITMRVNMQCRVFPPQEEQICLAPDRVSELTSDPEALYLFSKNITGIKRSSCYNQYYNKGIKYLKQSADLDYTRAQTEYALHLLHEMRRPSYGYVNPRINYGQNLSPTQKGRQAFIYLNKAAEKGDIVAIDLLKKSFDYEVPRKPIVSAKTPAIAENQIINEQTKLPAPSSHTPTVSKGSQDTIVKTEEPLYMRYVIVPQLNFRDAPKGVKLGAFILGEQVKVYEEKGDWLRIVTYTYGSVWIHRDYVSHKEPKPIPKTVVASKPVSINVPSDSASYYLLSKTKMSSGNWNAVTKRNGSSGTSYSRREINCRAQTFRYLGDGDTIKEMNGYYNKGHMADLVTGSISYHVVQHVCRNSNSMTSTKSKKKSTQPKAVRKTYGSGYDGQYFEAEDNGQADICWLIGNAGLAEGQAQIDKWKARSRKHNCRWTD
ncbi:MAG: hypothetical protein COA69_06365 [Robiginitomaculum sp.]|nr:MAG: hypothetical protein COA69_06365 [Robiginitomaculum sp.]